MKRVYTVMKAETAGELQEMVQTQLDAGSDLVGGVAVVVTFTGETRFYQAITSISL